MPGTNALKTANLVRDKMEELKQRFPEGLEYSIVYDTTPFITESISEVFITLIDAVLLVAFVVLLFLQNWRSAIIPLVAVPVAVIGTFAVMAAMGFSLNNLTLFGLVLAIGIVVDDAIVVVEAVEHHIEAGLPPKEATIKAMSQVSGPVIAVGLVLSAVFMPCAVHQRHHGAVLPPVRLDDRRVDGHFGVQFADAQPGAFAPCCCGRKEQEEGSGRGVADRRLSVSGRGARLRFLMPWAVQLCAPWRCPAGTRWPPASRSGWRWRWPPRGRLFCLRWPGRWIVFSVVPFRRFNVGFTWATEGYTRLVGMALRVSLLVLLVYGGLLCLTYWGFTNSPRASFPCRTRAICW